MVAGSIGVRASDTRVQSLCVVSALVFALVMAAGILAFGFKHPTQATLEGTEVIALKQLQLRAKDYIALQPADTVPVLEGLGKPPQSEEGCHE